MFDSLLCFFLGHKWGKQFEVDIGPAVVELNECPRCVTLHEVRRGWTIP